MKASITKAGQRTSGVDLLRKKNLLESLGLEEFTTVGASLCEDPLVPFRFEEVGVDDRMVVDICRFDVLSG